MRYLNLKRCIPILFGALLVAAGATGCTVYRPAQPAAGPRTESVYQPMYYNGAIVYYDDVGDPIYYEQDNVHYVPRGYVQYEQYRSHYRAHRRAYVTWSTTHPRPHASPHRRQQEDRNDRHRGD